LTNLNVAQLPGAVLTNNATSVTLSGSFTGILSGNASTATTATTANNFSGSLSGDVTGTQSATVVSTVGGQTAANVANGVIAANSATNTDITGAVVKRDSSGSFSARHITLDGNLNLPITTATGGIIYSGGSTLLHSYGSQNVFVGLNAGNLTMSGVDNIGIGFEALQDNTTGNDNTADGVYSLFSNMSGSYNTANGYQALQLNLTGIQNTANGVDALFYNTNGSGNTADGVGALQNNANGNYNTASGVGALGANTTGSYNIALGYAAGLNLTTGSSNIDIGNWGAAADTNIMRIGSGQTQTYIAGIYGATAASGVAVYVNSSGQLGTLTSSARFKQNIRSMDDASDVLLSLRPVKFQYKPQIDPQGIPQFGLVAEEVDKVDPDLVARDDKNQIYTVRYEAVNAMLLNEFQKEHRKIEEQNTEIQNLEQSVAELKQLVQTLAEKE
jgi:hypothetical protein